MQRLSDDAPGGVLSDWGCGLGGGWQGVAIGTGSLPVRPAFGGGAECGDGAWERWPPLFFLYASPPKRRLPAPPAAPVWA